MGRAAIEWTDEMLRLLGTDKDAVLAERWGTTAKTVSLKRKALHVPAFGHVQWTDSMLARLGTEVDADLAREWGISKASVIARRQELGIAAIGAAAGAKGQPFDWTDSAVALLGTDSDVRIAEQLGLSRLSVYNARMARGIAAASRRKPA